HYQQQHPNPADRNHHIILHSSVQPAFQQAAHSSTISPPRLPRSHPHKPFSNHSPTVLTISLPQMVRKLVAKK
ncbi:MAG: hypothetical protein J0L63_05985, partial [Anaerolineae bacterium]|nr:hypothetical protein [Anaerolineae bacterium]